MRCPSCEHVLTAELYEMAVTRHCRECGGRWLDFEALQAILVRREKGFPFEQIWTTLRESGRRSIPSGERQRELDCPICSEPMQPRVFGQDSSIVVHVCARRHGLLLDRGELEQLQIFQEYLQDYL